MNEAKEIKQLLPKEDYHYINDRQCLLTIKKTQYRCLKLKIDILGDYPQSNDSLIIELTSTHLCDRLIKQLNKGINKILESNRSKPRILLIVKSLNDIIQNNMLTMAFDEVHKIKKMFKNNKTVLSVISYPCTFYLFYVVIDTYRLH